jgi:hypothetical protein
MKNTLKAILLSGISLSYHYHRAQHGPRKILFIPEVPKRWYIIWKACRFAGIEPTTTADENVVAAFLFEDATWSTVRLEQFPVPNGTPVLNAACIDISKATVSNLFEGVFQRPIHVDPLVHQGLCVKKSDVNATHSGQIVQCPVAAREPGFVYQKLIDNTCGREHVVDLRVVIVGDEIPVVYKKYRQVRIRFENINSWAEFHRARDVFSDEEQRLLLLFARRIGLDVGEIDVLRDVADRQIYIVDVNKTPAGPPGGISSLEGIRAVSAVAHSLHRYLQRGKRGAAATDGRH